MRFFRPNPLSYLGWIVALVAFVTVLILMLADFLWFREQIYTSIITYLVVPSFLVGGIALAVLGYLLDWRRRRRKGELPPDQYPTLDLNKAEQRRALAWFVGLATVFVALSAVGGYKAYHITESVTFCGAACHAVMEPEYTAYRHSPHARVKCVECHIGSGANWYVKSKMSGLRQVYAYPTGTYSLPIDVPVHNLRPAQDTCEQCHWPEKFSGSFERVFWHTRKDEANTPLSFRLLMKVGGGSSKTGEVSGIHWHTSRDHKVEYWAEDEQRSVIPWVRVTHPDGSQEVFTSGDVADPPAREIRIMDCIDCHNRPSHIYQPPFRALNASLAHGRLDRSIPSIYETSLALFDENYPDKPTALRAIEQGLRDAYAEAVPAASLESAIREVQAVYSANIFPEQGTDWRTYANHIGHFDYPGCARCHDDNHKSPGGKVISNDCALCHDIIAQAEGAACFEPPVYQVQPYAHPGGDGWEDMLCVECHAADQPVPATKGGRPKKVARAGGRGGD